MTDSDAAVARINCALERVLDTTHVSPDDQVPVGHTVAVCHATEEEWTAYVESENQVYPSRFLFWDETSQLIIIVEFAGGAHESFTDELRDQFNVLRTYIPSRGASYDDAGRRFEPDLSYGPRRRTMEPLGAIPPPIGIPWFDYKTLRVEVGVSQGWGHANGHLDFKADVWMRRPCIAYVLCVHVDGRLQNGSYKLYQVRQPPHANAPAIPLFAIPPFQPIPTPIQPPATFIELETRYLLGLPDNAALPNNVPGQIRIDLYAVLIDAHALLTE